MDLGWRTEDRGEKQKNLEWAKKLLPPIPESVATIEDAYQIPQGSSPSETIILIQDAHTNSSCQLNEAKLFDLLFQNGIADTVFTEAANGNANLTFLRDRASLSKRQNIAKEYLQKGLLHGIEYLDLTSDHNFKVVGVEDPNLYFKSLQVYKQSIKKRDRFESYLQEIESTIEVLKPKLLNPFLLSFLEKYNKAKKDETSFSDYVDALFLQANVLNIDLNHFPNLLKLKELKNFESKIDFKDASLEQQKAIESLGAEDQRELSGQSASKLSMKDSQKGFFLYLKEKLKGTTKYPELFKYFAYLEKSNSLSPKDLLSEKKALEDQIFKNFTTNEDESKLLLSIKVLEFYKKLFHLSLTPEEYEEFKKEDFADIKTLSGFLNQKLMVLKGHYEKAIFLKEDFTDMANLCKKFYELTYERDKVFLKNISAIQDSKSLPSRQAGAILITGGYHTPNLKYLLKQRNISYISIIPEVTHETNIKRYEEILLGQISVNVKQPVVSTVAAKMDMTAYVMGQGRMAATAKAQNIKKDILAGAVYSMNAARLADNGGSSNGDARVAKTNHPKNSAGEMFRHLILSGAVLLGFSVPLASQSLAQQDSSQPSADEKTKPSPSIKKYFGDTKAQGEAVDQIVSYPQTGKNIQSDKESNSQPNENITSDKEAKLEKPKEENVLMTVANYMFFSIAVLFATCATIWGLYKMIRPSVIMKPPSASNLQALGSAYASLTLSQQSEVYLILKTQAEKGNLNALEALRSVYTSLTPSQQSEAFPILKQLADSGYEQTLLALSGIGGQLDTITSAAPVETKATPQISNPDEVREDFQKHYDSLKKAAVEDGNGHALLALGSAYTSLTPSQKSEVYLILKTQAKNGNSNGLYALGSAYASLTLFQQSEIYPILKANPGTGIACAYASLTPSQKSEVYLILKTKADKENKDAVLAMGPAYASLTLFQQSEIYPILKAEVDKGNGDALLALGSAYASLTPSQQSEIYPILKTEAGSGSGDAFWALGLAYASLAFSQQSEIYPILKTEADNKSVFSHEALGFAHASLTPSQKSEIYAILKTEAGKGYGTALRALGAAYASLTTSQQSEIYPILKTGAEKGNSGADVALGFAYTSLTSSQQSDIYTILRTKADKGDGDALWALSKIYGKLNTMTPVTPVETKATPQISNPDEVMADFQKLYDFLKTNAVDLKYSSSLLALGSAYTSLTSAQQLDIYATLKTGADEENEFALWDLGLAYASLTSAQQVDIYATLKTIVDKGSEVVLRALGLAYASLTLSQQSEIFIILKTKAESGSGRALLALGSAYASLTSSQQSEIYTLFRTEAKTGQEIALQALGSAYASLTSSQQSEVYPILKTQAENGNQYALRALGPIYASLTLSQQSAIYPILKAQVNSGNGVVLLALGAAYVFLNSPQQAEIYLILKTKVNNGSEQALLALSEIYGKLNRNVPVPQVYGKPDFKQLSSFLHREIDYHTGRVIPVEYAFVPMVDTPTANPEAQRVMAMYRDFEKLNSEVLQKLGKPNKSPEDILALLDTMQLMVLSYEVLFKGQPPGKSLDSIAKESSDLQGGRSIAKLFLNIRHEVEGAMDSLRSLPGKAHAIQPSIEAMMQLFDSKKSSRLTVAPAEGYETRVRSINLGDYIAFIGSGTPISDEAVSFAELINIVHQKGVRNLGGVMPSGGSQRVSTCMVSSADSRTQVNVKYLDARQKPQQEHSIAVLAVTQAFSLNQLRHKNSRFFDPSNALVMADENTALIGLKLGLHSAAIHFSLLPVQEEGRILVSYMDNIEKIYEPGNSTRFRSICDAFEAAGFMVSRDGYHMEAVFDKDHGASSIADLPEKLNFAVQVVTSTLDLDLAINRSPHVNASDLTSEFVANGYLLRSDKDSVMVPTPLPAAVKQVEALAVALGIEVPDGMPSGQRMMDFISHGIQTLISRGALVVIDDGNYKFDAAYQEASARNFPVARLIEAAYKADQLQIIYMRQVAAIARSLQSFCSRTTIGEVGPYLVEELKLAALGDQITFYVLKDTKSSQFVLGTAILGEFFMNQRRYDLFRKRELVNNKLSPYDLEELLLPQGFASTSAFREWFESLAVQMSGARLAGAANSPDGARGIFSAISNEHLLNRMTGPFKKKQLLERPNQRRGISAVSLGGVRLNLGKAIGFARFKQTGRSADEFKNGILIADYTDNEDDPSIAAANGVAITTGGSLSHAAIRARENRKPAVIFNGASVHNQVLRFKTYTADTTEMKIEVGGKEIVFHAIADAKQTTCEVHDGDLVYLDANQGTLYFIAGADDLSGETVIKYTEYLMWKERMETKASYEILPKDVNILGNIISRISNQNLVRALLDQILGGAVLPSDSIESLLTQLSENPVIRSTILEFVRSQAGELIDQFQADLKKFHQYIEQKKYARRYDFEQVFLEADKLMKQAERLDRTMLAANGDWKHPFTAMMLQSSRAEMIEKGREWLGAARKEISAEVESAVVELSGSELPVLLSFWNKLELAGMTGEEGDSTIKEKILVIKLKIDALKKAREDEIKELQGRGVVWKENLKDRFSRPIAGGKGSNSAETTYAVKQLQERGLIDSSVQVATPEGFVIQPTEYFLWRVREHPEELNSLEGMTGIDEYANDWQRQLNTIFSGILELIKTDEETSADLRIDIHQAISGFVDKVRDAKGPADIFELTSKANQSLNALIDTGNLAEKSWKISAALQEKIEESKGIDLKLQANLAFAYRDLTVKQLNNLERLIAIDERTSVKFKTEVKTKILKFKQNLQRSQELHSIDGLILSLRDSVELLLLKYETSDVSRSIGNSMKVLGAVAVRSSGLKEDSVDEAMAGMKETKLNVFGIQALSRAVVDVWLSGAESILVDEMINPKASGVAFSADPAQQRADHIRVDAAHGLAKGLVDQTVKDPDSYLFSKTTSASGRYELLDSHVGVKTEQVLLDLGPQGGYKVEPNAQALEPALNEQQLQAVAEVVYKLSEYFGTQIDMEWSLDADDRIVVLQVRPITTIRESIERGKNIIGSPAAHVIREKNSTGGTVLDGARLAKPNAARLATTTLERVPTSRVPARRPRPLNLELTQGHPVVNIQKGEVITFIAQVITTQNVHENKQIAIGSSVIQIVFRDDGKAILYGLADRGIAIGARKIKIRRKGNQTTATMSLADYRLIMEEAAREARTLYANVPESFINEPAVVILNTNAVLPQGNVTQLAIQLLVAQLHNERRTPGGKFVRYVVVGHQARAMLKEAKRLYPTEKDLMVLNFSELQVTYQKAERVYVTSSTRRHQPNSKTRFLYLLDLGERGVLNPATLTLASFEARLEELSISNPYFVQFYQAYQKQLGREFKPKDLPDFINALKGLLEDLKILQQFALPPVMKLAVEEMIQTYSLMIKMALQAA